ncbi:MAG: hypothetical protein K2X93_15870 [Candidatus Obscuribacterales bacterium]|nr:hypothetical protein [Candidatus Obscuribacterales bacterium]
MRRVRRNTRGNQISEFGPAVILLVVVLMVPLFIMVYIGFGFCCGWYLNYMSARAVAVAKRSDSAVNQALTSQEAAWNASGLPKFAGATCLKNGGDPPGYARTAAACRKNTDVDSPPAPRELDDFAIIHTLVEVDPFVNIPYHAGIGPFTFHYRCERPIEEYDIES